MSTDHQFGLTKFND